MSNVGKISKIKKSLVGGAGQQSHSSGDGKAFVKRNHHPAPVIHEKEVSVEFDGQSDRRCFPGAKICNRIGSASWMNFEPSGKIGVQLRTKAGQLYS